MDDEKYINDDDIVDERIIYLANELNVDPSAIRVSKYGEDTFDVALEDEDRTYLVLDEDEAEERASQSVYDFIDELGHDSFTPEFQDWIYNNAFDDEWFRDFYLEDYYSYAEDIESEEDDEYGNRLNRECVEAGIISEDDIVDGEYQGDTYKLYDELAQKMVDDLDGDYAGQYKLEFGSFEGVPNDVWDDDKIVDKVLEWDGRGQQLATYDGDEIELADENGYIQYYAYRID